MQPLWLRFVMLAAILAVCWGAVISPTSRSPVLGIWSTVTFALFFGVGLAGFLTYRDEATHKALTEAVAALDTTKRSEAIAAVSRGIAPADPTVRSSAIRLGAAYLGGKSRDQLKRQERQTWLALAFGGGLCIAAAVMNFGEDRLLYLALALVGAVVLPLGLLSTRRIQRNFALLSEPPKPSR